MLRCFALFLLISAGDAFCPTFHCRQTVPTRLNSAAVDEDISVQWDLFKKHHAKGEWKGIWTSYDYIGDVVDETVARYGKMFAKIR